MKKYAKKVLCLVLAVLLLSSMAVPAVASSGTYEYKDYLLNFTVTRTETYGMATISTPAKPTTVGAYVKNYVYCEECGSVSIVDSGHIDPYTMVPNMGYASVTVFAYNEFTDNKGTHEGVIQQTQGYFWVGDVMVLGQVLA